MDDLGKFCSNKKCKDRKIVLESMCPLCKDVDYCDEKCLRQDKKRHRGECALMKACMKRKANSLQADPPALILEEIATDFVLREELASLYFMSLMRERDYGCMIIWITNMNELAIAYNSGSQIKSTWFTFVPGKKLEKDDRMFGLVEMAKMSIPANRLISVAVVVEGTASYSSGVYGRLFEASSKSVEKI